MEIIKISRELGLLEEIENDKRVELILGNDKKFYERFSEKIYLVEDIFIYEPLLKSLPSEYEEFKEVIKSFYIAKINIKRYAHIAKENEIINIKNNYKCIDEFLKNFHIKNEVVVVACAGPSLEKDLKVMKEKREHIKIFAVGKALDILMRNKIKPDMITVLDPNEIVYEQIKGYENLDIPICFLSTASRWVTKAYKGPKYIFFNKPCEYNKSNIIVKTGKTVSVPTIDLAIKAGAKKVILCGQDLAFVNDKLHVGDIENVEKSVFYKSVLGVDGTYLNTTSGMLEFKKNIEELITENKDIEFINSSKGAKIKGTIEKELHSCI
ncbi:motility associated factor glycosyltransferase family protein [Clostridium tetanomorphum]|nr:6-hydroxymethylpterin diphosphokinase MptE-like protein [Clostridium tetanomorphum]SQC03125.1 putative transmembrane anchored MAF_flag10 domain protein [Clostridium tetanomorphum]